MNLSLGENIKRKRIERKLTQEEVATHLGVSFQSVSKWERGEGYPDIELLPSLANYFDVSVDELLGMSNSEKTERYENIKDSFALNENCNIEGKTLLLCDDIKTTGSTLRECCDTLLKGGAKDVYCVCLALTPYLKYTDLF